MNLADLNPGNLLVIALIAVVVYLIVSHKISTAAIHGKVDAIANMVGGALGKVDSAAAAASRDPVSIVRGALERLKPQSTAPAAQAPAPLPPPTSATPAAPAPTTAPAAPAAPAPAQPPAVGYFYDPATRCVIYDPSFYSAPSDAGRQAVQEIQGKYGVLTPIKTKEGWDVGLRGDATDPARYQREASWDADPNFGDRRNVKAFQLPAGSPVTFAFNKPVAEGLCWQITSTTYGIGTTVDEVAATVRAPDGTVLFDQPHANVQTNAGSQFRVPPANLAGGVHTCTLTSPRATVVAIQPQL